jgi:hypothetical protein
MPNRLRHGSYVYRVENQSGNLSSQRRKMVDDKVTGMTIRVACKIKDLQSEIAKAWHNAIHPKH